VCWGCVERWSWVCSVLSKHLEQHNHVIFITCFWYVSGQMMLMSINPTSNRLEFIVWLIEVRSLQAGSYLLGISIK